MLGQLGVFYLSPRLRPLDLFGTFGSMPRMRRDYGHLYGIANPVVGLEGYQSKEPSVGAAIPTKYKDLVVETQVSN